MTIAHLFDGSGNPLSKGAPASINTVGLKNFPVCGLVGSSDMGTQTVDLILVVVAPEAGTLPQDWVGYIVATLDAGGVLALHALNDEAYRDTHAQLLRWWGGGNA